MFSSELIRRWTTLLAALLLAAMPSVSLPGLNFSIDAEDDDDQIETAYVLKVAFPPRSIHKPVIATSIHSNQYQVWVSDAARSNVSPVISLTATRCPILRC